MCFFPHELCVCAFTAQCRGGYLHMSWYVPLLCNCLLLHNEYRRVTWLTHGKCRLEKLNRACR